MNRLEIEKLKLGSRIAQVVGKIIQKKDDTTDKGVRWMNITLELLESVDTINIVFFYAMVDKYINILNINDLIDIQDAEVKYDSYSGRNLTVRSDTVITTKDHDYIVPKTDSDTKVLPTPEQTGEDLYGKQEHKDPKPFKNFSDIGNAIAEQNKSSLEKQVEDNKKLLDKALGVKEENKPFKSDYEKQVEKGLEPNDEPNDEEINHRGFYNPNKENQNSEKTSFEKDPEKDVYGKLEYRSELSKEEAKQINKNEAHRQLEEELERKPIEDRTPKITKIVERGLEKYHENESKEYFHPDNPYSPIPIIRAEGDEVDLCTEEEELEHDEFAEALKNDPRYTTEERKEVQRLVKKNRSHVAEIEKIKNNIDKKQEYYRKEEETRKDGEVWEKYEEERRRANTEFHKKEQRKMSIEKYDPNKELIIPLNMESVKKFFPTLKKCSDEEIMIALHKCTLHGLDPMRDEVYLIPYTNQKTGETTVRLTISIDTWLARANEQPDFDGTEGGIVVKIPKDKDGITREQREGAIMFEGEELLGAYAIVHKKNKRPTFRSISFKTFKGNTHFWRDMPAIMIEKVALSLCLRKAYPVAFKGLYSQAELDQAKE